MPITLVEVYQLIADIARQAQESEAKARAYAEQVEQLIERVQRLEHERDGNASAPPEA